ncbi:F0F1 ATP synthase subunit B [Jatrophihabitans endophyticus]|uniref:F0F1 ATP synthase subunit B n=1 Tax=Jatrophihabitans endophyticus TaxID=1206085 RepID=UPI001A0BC551|nr:F0F1 ATP synthase subunit B [Jatrophihabitans endophyticus]MBE7188864.1 F0F1 ATP synthase subunit B [Jatrophihabitans endophyticus]
MAQPSLASGNFLLPNYTFFVEVIVFLVIMFVLGRFVVPKLQGTLTSRNELVRKQVEDTEKARTFLADAQKAYQDALTGARTEAAEIRERARAEAQRTIDDLHANAQSESARILARGEAQLATQRTEILRELRSEIGTLAVELSEKIVGHDLGGRADVTATVDNFLAGLAADDHARSEATS